MTTRYLPLAQIIVPENRQRTDWDDPKVQEHIVNLMEALFRADGPGMLNPITLRDGNVLMAGECRTRAVTMGYKLGRRLRHAGQPVPEGHIPFIDFGELDAIQRMEAEFSENAVRLDLNWKDKAKAIAGLHALRAAQKENKGLPPQTFAETAQELFKASKGQPADTVAKSVQLVKMLDNPSIAKAASFKEAVKVLGKLRDQEQNVKLAAAVGKVAASDRMRAFNEDCIKWMAGQPAETYDVILTDPPYGMDADGFGDAAGRLAGTEHKYRDDRDGTIALLTAAIPEFFRLAKPQAHLYLWCDIDLFHWLRDQCAAAGWRVHRTPLVNVKPEGGRVPWPDYGPRRAYELCLYAVKGDRPVTSIRPDVFESRLVEGNLGHGAQKPVQAFVELLGRSVRPGDKVLDAFAGSGTIFPAAAAVGCYADGVELSEASYGMCVKRIKELK